MRRFAISLLIFLLAACTSQSGGQTLTVFAAASLADAFTELGAAFEATQPGITVTLNFAGSQTLRTQLEYGAQADVFASANLKHIQGVVAAGLIAADSVEVFTTNALVVIVPADNPAGIETLADLTQPGLRLVLAAPVVPVGDYTRQVLDNLAAAPGLGPTWPAAVLMNLVSEENNVRQVLTKVQLGEADAGIVYRSDVTPTVRASVQEIDIPPDYNILASYEIAPLQAATHTEQARAFVAFVLSSQGQAILARWGFGAANS